MSTIGEACEDTIFIASFKPASTLRCIHETHHRRLRFEFETSLLRLVWIRSIRDRIDLYHQTDERTYLLWVAERKVSVRNLWRTHVSFYLEFTTHTVNNDIQCNSPIPAITVRSFLVSVSTEGWVFFSQFCRLHHLILVGFWLRFNRYFDNWI